MSASSALVGIGALAVAIHVALLWITAIRRGIAGRRREDRAASHALWGTTDDENGREPSPQPSLSSKGEGAGSVPRPSADGCPLGPSKGRMGAVRVSGHEVPPVTILVPAWREKGTVERCISSLKQLSYPLWEALIVAGGPDGTYEAALEAVKGDERLRVLEQEPRGKNAALVQGIAAARHDVLVFLDADSEVAVGWLEALVRPLALGANVAMGNYLPRRETWVSLAEQMEKIQAYNILGSASIQGSGSVAIRRATLTKVGGLPEEVRVGVDWDLGVRLTKAREQIVFTDAARLVTDRPATLQDFWANELRWRRAHLRGMWRHHASLLRGPTAAVVGLYFYGFSTVVALATVASVGVFVAQPMARSVVSQILALAVVWLLARRAALGAEVAAYTGQTKWLQMAWAPAALLAPAMAASIVACLTAWWGQIWFQGPRHGEKNIGH